MLGEAARRCILRDSRIWTELHSTTFHLGGVIRLLCKGVSVYGDPTSYAVINTGSELHGSGGAPVSVDKERKSRVSNEEMLWQSLVERRFLR
jgi:hypothetical protein